MKHVLAAGIAAIAVAAPVAAQKITPAELATRLTGTWVLNREMSPGFSAPGRRGRGQAPAARPLLATAPLAQRGGGRGGGGAGGVSDATDLTPGERAAQAAMRQLYQIGSEITVKASAGSVTFIDARGERTYAIDDKSAKIDVSGSPVSVKSKWDKSVLRQEFSNTQAKLVQSWATDDSGKVLFLTAKVESMTLQTPEQKAVFDRK